MYEWIIKVQLNIINVITYNYYVKYYFLNNNRFCLVTFFQYLLPYFVKLKSNTKKFRYYVTNEPNFRVAAIIKVWQLSGPPNLKQNILALCFIITLCILWLRIASGYYVENKKLLSRACIERTSIVKFCSVATIGVAVKTFINNRSGLSLLLYNWQSLKWKSRVGFNG